MSALVACKFQKAQGLARRLLHDRYQARSRALTHSYRNLPLLELNRQIASAIPGTASPLSTTLPIGAKWCLVHTI